MCWKGHSVLTDEIMPKNNEDATDETPKAIHRPAATLLRAWGKRMAHGRAVVIPVYVGGVWTLQVPRGNKRVLRLSVPKKKAS